MEKNVKSELNAVEDQEVVVRKNELITELYQGGPLGDAIKRKMRVGVEAILTKEHGSEFSSNNYWAISQMIINASLCINKPELFSRVLAKDQVEKVQQKYPLQLQMVKCVIEVIDNAKRYYQLKNLSDSNILNTLL